MLPCCSTWTGKWAVRTTDITSKNGLKVRWTSPHSPWPCNSKTSLSRPKSTLNKTLSTPTKRRVYWTTTSAKTYSEIRSRCSSAKVTTMTMSKESTNSVCSTTKWMLTLLCCSLTKLDKNTTTNNSKRLKMTYCSNMKK